MNGSAHFAAVFEGLARTEQAEETVVLGGVNVRMVRVVGGLEGRWDSHGHKRRDGCSLEWRSITRTVPDGGREMVESA